MMDIYTKKSNSIISYFWVGFILYTTSYVLTITGYVNFVLYQGIQIIGVLIFVPTAISLIYWRFDNENLRIKYLLYCMWSIFIILRGFSLDYYSIKFLIVDAYDGIFVYMVPVVLLFPKGVPFIKKIFNVIIILAVIYLLLNIFFIKDVFLTLGRNVRSQGIVEVFSKSLSIPSGFFLLTYLYHSRKRRFFALFIIILTFIIAIIRARRGLGFMAFSILVASYFIYYSLNKSRILNILISFLLVVLTIFFAINTFSSNKSGLFSYFNERTVEDTRKGVEECLYQDMRLQDWIFGKGIFGNYYCPGVDEGFGGQVIIYRYGIETDYLNIILKGGIISLGLLLLIAIPAVIKGIFFSKNILSKASGIWIMLYLKDLYPTPVTDFTLNYILVWVSVGICYSNQIRQKTDEELKMLFQKLSK